MTTVDKQPSATGMKGDDPTVSGISKVLPPMNTKPMTEAEISSGPLRVARSLINTFSTVQYQRDAPNPSKTKHIRLITITLSHYCEKIRWGLDLLEQDTTSPYYYTEDGHPPAFVAFFTVPASNNTCSATPMAVYGDANLVEGNSEKLLNKLCPFLYPDPIQEEIQKLEHDMGKRVGATLRCFVYHHLLQPAYNTAGISLAVANTSKIESILFNAMFTLGISDGMRKVMKINEDSARISRDELIEVFDELSRRLEEGGGEYLMDTKDTSYGFTAADLTLAALAYHLLRPPEMANFLLSKDDEYPPEVLQLSQQLQATRAGQHVLRMYQKHRPTNSVVIVDADEGKPSQEQAIVVLKSAKIRDRWCLR